jgi:hypothetical protein
MTTKSTTKPKRKSKSFSEITGVVQTRRELTTKLDTMRQALSADVLVELAWPARHHVVLEPAEAKSILQTVIERFERELAEVDAVLAAHNLTAD